MFGCVRCDDISVRLMVYIRVGYARIMCLDVLGYGINIDRLSSGLMVSIEHKGDQVTTSIHAKNLVLTPLDVSLSPHQVQPSTIKRLTCLPPGR
jgi:hypothetical protein